MNDSTRPSTPLRVASDSAQRVALELADQIAQHEPGSGGRDRMYFLTLYSQCLSVVSGGTVKHALERETVPQRHAGELTLLDDSDQNPGVGRPAGFSRAEPEDRVPHRPAIGVRQWNAPSGDA